MAQVHIGYFEHFKQGKTVLIDCDQESIALVIQLLRALASGEVKIISIHSLPFVEAHQDIKIIARCTNKDEGMYAREGIFQWDRTGDGWNDAAEKVSDLVNGGGHHYLEALRDEVTVLVSSGEYGNEWWIKHG